MVGTYKESPEACNMQGNPQYIERCFKSCCSLHNMICLSQNDPARILWSWSCERVEESFLPDGTKNTTPLRDRFRLSWSQMPAHQLFQSLSSTNTLHVIVNATFKVWLAFGSAIIEKERKTTKGHAQKDIRAVCESFFL